MGDFNTANYYGLYLTSRDYAAEFGVTSTYQMYDNFKIVVEANYIALWLDQSKDVWGGYTTTSGSRMKKFSALLWLALILIPLSATAAEPLRVVAGTSLISDIVADLTDGKSETLTLIQGSSCPGHGNAHHTGDSFALPLGRLER